MAIGRQKLKRRLRPIIDAQIGLPELLEDLQSIRSKLAFESACNKSAGRGATFASELATLDAILAKNAPTLHAQMVGRGQRPEANIAAALNMVDRLGLTLKIPEAHIENPS